jgi:hypothetical protein
MPLTQPPVEYNNTRRLKLTNQMPGTTRPTLARRPLLVQLTPATPLDPMPPNAQPNLHAVTTD